MPRPRLASLADADATYQGFTEELRGNINSFADTTVGTHGRADKDRHGVVADGTSRQGTSTGMSKDAEALGQGLKNAVGGSGSGSTTTSTTK